MLQKKFVERIKTQLYFQKNFPEVTVFMWYCSRIW